MSELFKELLNPQIVRLLPEDFIRRNKVLPVKLDNEVLEVAMANPDDLEVIDEIKLLSGFEIIPVVVPAIQLQAAIEKYFEVEETSKQTLIDVRIEGLKALKDKKIEKKVGLEETDKTKEVPVVKLMHSIIEGAINSGASDIHLEPQDPEMRVRYRVDGLLHDIMVIPRHIESSLISRAKILASMDISEKRRPQDGHISYHFGGNAYDLRVSVLPDVAGEKIVLRILDKNKMLLGLEQLGLSPENEEIIKTLSAHPYGMIFVTGPTGSGKTTTLYSILNRLNKEAVNIVTIEDPVEFKLTGVSQIQTKPQIGVTFANGLRTILRQDPDIIMVGEVRDAETAEIAIQAALTGHLVLSTLHTNDAPSAVTRLIDMGVEPFLISSTVIGVIAQRLARRICRECKGKGCYVCYQTGMKGRTGVFEIMSVNENIKVLINEKKPAEIIKEQAIKKGMKTLEMSGQEKIEQGICTPEEIRRVVSS